MDNREAKFILSAYRPGGQDANDPCFAEALDQVRRDPMLDQWFRDSVVFDAAVAEKFRAIEVPADLRENILVGVKVSRPLRWPTLFNKMSHSLRWPAPVIGWAIAAALVIAAFVGSLLLRETTKPRLAGWQTEALHTVSSLLDGRVAFDVQSRTGADLISWLQASRAPAAETLPKNVANLETLGCKTFLWNEELVSVICFRRPDGGLIHLVARNASAPSDQALKREPELVRQGDWATATWREGDKVYMLALEGSPDQLRTYLL
jgi:hypothetical protein